VAGDGGEAPIPREIWLELGDENDGRSGASELLSRAHDLAALRRGVARRREAPTRA
jgi:hypothetical protein